MASGYQAGRKGYPVRLFLTFDGAASLAWATYGGLVGHIGGTALTQTAWRLFAVAAVAAVIFGTAGWVLALFGGRRDDGHAEAEHTEGTDAGRTDTEREAAPADTVDAAAAQGAVTAARAASAGGPPRRSNPTATGRS
jgi:membrane-associated protein